MKSVNVFAIKRSDKSLVQSGDDAVSHLVSAMFDFLELVESRLHAGGILENVMQQACALVRFCDTSENMRKNLLSRGMRRMNVGLREAGHIRHRTGAGAGQKTISWPFYSVKPCSHLTSSRSAPRKRARIDRTTQRVRTKIAISSTTTMPADQ